LRVCERERERERADENILISKEEVTVIGKNSYFGA
jgi:hypothetical protein